MDGVPTPLRVGSPAMTRNGSNDSVPSALRVGSPVVQSPGAQERPPLMRQNTSGSDRLSQLFPSRPPSAASASPDLPSSRRTSYPASRRTSFPSPLVPTADTYQVPRAPPPPSFSPSFAEDTSYNANTHPFDSPVSPPARQKSTSKQLINRLATLRAGRSKGGAYNKLDDEENGHGRGRLKGLEEVEEPLGYDLSGFDGLPMNKFEPLKKKKKNAADATQQERDLDEAGYAAEFERLEAQLGAGMSAVHEVPFTHKAARPDQLAAGHRRGLSSAKAVTIEAVASEVAQKEAEKTGGIVATEIPVDLSGSYAGGDFETRSIMSTAGGVDEDGTKKSYYFPEDPDMPSWRPFSMGWPWLSFLIVIALLLAGIQEFLCQLSIKRVRNDPEGGLIKFRRPSELSVPQYFTWKYAPVLFFVIYGILWQITDFEVKRLEPFYQLSKKQGATAAESLNMDYLTFMSWLVPFRALAHKQYAVIYVSLATLTAGGLVPILQSASVNTWPPQNRRKAQGWKSIRIDPAWSRAVTGCLLFVAICGAVLMYEMRRKSGLQSDPNGIAGVAAMATRSHILADFHGLDTAPLDRIHKQLRHRRYILHKSSLWQGEYIRTSKERIRETGSDPRALMLRKKAGVPYIVSIVLFAILVPIFIFVDKAGLITEKLPWLLTAMATGLRLLWGTMNCDIRMLEPFYILSRRRAPAKTLTLDYTGTNPIFLPFKALMNRHYIVALVGIGAILAEILTVCVSSFSVDGKKFIPGHGGDDDNNDEAYDRYNTDETFRSFWISFSLVQGILLSLTIIATIVVLRRSHKFMPRQTGTMASVLGFIHQSKMLVSFVDTEKMDSSAMTRHLESKGKTYALGWLSGRDGDDHCGIDEEEILAEYRWGVDWTKTRVLGNQIGTWEHY